MKNAILITVVALLAGRAYGHGFTVSTIEEVHGKVEHIFAVKVLAVSKPEKQYTGAEPYPVELQFEITETLKGVATAKTNAIYTLPAIERETVDGTVMRVWLKTPASGQELSVVKGKEYLLYVPKLGILADKPAIGLVRIDPISEKKKLMKLLESTKKSQQSDREATAKPAPKGAASAASHP